jgi:hypothetical protein
MKTKIRTKALLFGLKYKDNIKEKSEWSMVNDQFKY